jgi:hypothetical protein
VIGSSNFSFPGFLLAVVPVFISLFSGSKKTSKVEESDRESIAEATEEGSQNEAASQDRPPKGS